MHCSGVLLSTMSAWPLRGLQNDVGRMLSDLVPQKFLWTYYMQIQITGKRARHSGAFPHRRVGEAGSYMAPGTSARREKLPAEGRPFLENVFTYMVMFGLGLGRQHE